MRFLLLSDLHSNLEAVSAALDRAGEIGYDRALILGDIVGYGADPNAVIERLRALDGPLAIRGNHDKVAAGLDEGEGFNEAARIAALWTRRALSPDNLSFLRDLPRGPLEFAPGRLLCHGTPLDEDEYLMDVEDARRCFGALPFDLCFFGHSHYPGAFVLVGDRITRRPAAGDEAVLEIAEGHRYLINPGSVGQPRDRNTKCGFAVYDDRERRVLLVRVDYAADAARNKILDAGLPRWLGDRLLVGA